MPIPFEPEGIDSLRNRFPACLDKVWVPVLNMEDRPGLHREYVFDFHSGLRLIISKMQSTELPVTIQVSASFSTHEPQDLDEFKKHVEVAYKLIGGPGKLVFLGLSHNGIPHWRVELAN